MEMKSILLKLLLVLDIFGLISCRWTHSASLDPLDKYHLKWFFDDHKQQITFKVVVETRGWIGFGVSANGGMSGSDLVIGWIDDTGFTHFHDRFAEEEELPTIDDSQDWHLLSSGQNGSHTWLEFTRAYFTCDSEMDLQITSDITKLIWAFNDDKPSADNAMAQHKAANRGTRSVHLLSVPDLDFVNVNHESIERWDITSSNMLIPDEMDTIYWCKIVIAPFKHKVHVIRIEPIISPASNAPFVHHMVLYRCLHPNASHLEQYADHGGHNCVDIANMPYDFIHCQSVYMVWATGGGPFNMPKDVGMPIAEDHETTYFLFEIHYDNPELLKGKYDSSGLRLFYTRNLRPYDADTATLGSVVDYRLLIPPKQEAVTIAGHCHPDCFRHRMPKTGLRVIASLPHAHKHAKKILVRHFRNDSELRPIAEENNYDFNFQDFQRSLDQVILPGDQITVECTYDTRKRKRPLFGGLSTQEEMCLVFILYYPRMKASRSCLSGLTPQTVMTLSDVGAVKNTVDDDLDPLIAIPSNYANERLSSYVQNKSYWDSDLMNASQQMIRFAPQKAQCYWRKIEGLEGMAELDDLIEYPKVVAFKPPVKECQTLAINSGHHSKQLSVFSVIFLIVFYDSNNFFKRL